MTIMITGLMIVVGILAVVGALLAAVLLVIDR